MKNKPTAAAMRAAKSLGCYGITSLRQRRYAAKVIDIQFFGITTAAATFLERIANAGSHATFSPLARKIVMDAIDDFQLELSEIL